MLFRSRSSGRHRRIARDDPDLSEKQAEDEVRLIGLVISLLDRGNYDGRWSRRNSVQKAQDQRYDVLQGRMLVCGFNLAPKRAVEQLQSR